MVNNMRLKDSDKLIEEIRFVSSLVNIESRWLHDYVSGLHAAIELEDVVGGYCDDPDEKPKVKFCHNCGDRMDGE